jgi:type II secretory pathway predicted ATPase ExeA
MPLPEIHEGPHPVLRQRGFALASPPLVEMEVSFRQALNVGELSLCVFGKPRTGKTTAGRYLERKLQSTGEAVVAFAFIERQQRSNQIDKTEFWQWFLSSLGGKASISSPNKVRELLINWLRVAADKAETTRVILICDEAQNLVFHHLTMLKKLVDELIDISLTPFVLFLAQPEIGLRPEELCRANAHDLVDRYFTRWHRLRGLKIEEFEGILSQFDRLRWPVPEGLSFTEYFAGPQVQHGWRLSHEARAFAQAYSRLHKDLGLGDFNELETKFLISAVRLLLTSIQAANAEGRAVSITELVAQCVLDSGFVDSRRAVGDAENVIKYRKFGVASKMASQL